MEVDEKTEASPVKAQVQGPYQSKCPPPDQIRDLGKKKKLEVTYKLCKGCYDVAFPATQPRVCDHCHHTKDCPICWDPNLGSHVCPSANACDGETCVMNRPHKQQKAPAEEKTVIFDELEEMWTKEQAEETAKKGFNGLMNMLDSAAPLRKVKEEAIVKKLAPSITAVSGGKRTFIDLSEEPEEEQRPLKRPNLLDRDVATLTYNEADSHMVELAFELDDIEEQTRQLQKRLEEVIQRRAELRNTAIDRFRGNSSLFKLLHDDSEMKEEDHDD